MEDYVANATSSLSNTIRALNNQYYGFYRGTVVDNDDTANRGRCKVYIRGVYNEEFKEDDGKLLPWAEPCQPLFCGGGGPNGTFQCPDIGSTVWCFFENSDILKPVFFGQTTDKDGIFNTSKCKVHWEDMDIELDKTMHSITLSADRVYIKSKFTEIDGKEIKITADAKLNISSEIFETEGDLTPANGVDGIIDGKSIATVKAGMIVGIA